jgi:hypothetical protein
MSSLLGSSAQPFLIADAALVLGGERRRKEEREGKILSVGCEEER